MSRALSALQGWRNRTRWVQERAVEGGALPRDGAVPNTATREQSPGAKVGLRTTGAANDSGKPKAGS